jgi:hypothetical protein
LGDLISHHFSPLPNLCGISEFSNPGDDSFGLRLYKAAPGRKYFMHDLLIALAFIGMVVAPALVAAKAGNEAADDAD